jgi:excisionase family DNA binding protein
MLVSKPAAARILGVSVDTVTRMIEAGTLRPVYLRPNAHPRFRVADLEALVADKVGVP